MTDKLTHGWTDEACMERALTATYEWCEAMLALAQEPRHD